MDTVGLRKKVSAAKVFVKEYEAKKLRLDAMMQASTESTDTREKATLLLWIDNNSKWLEANKEEYEHSIILTNIPDSDIEHIAACEKALYGS